MDEVIFDVKEVKSMFCDPECCVFQVNVAQVTWVYCILRMSCDVEICI
jgi:hypothetical protein